MFNLALALCCFPNRCDYLSSLIYSLYVLIVECANIYQCSKGRDFSQHLVPGLIGIQTLRPQLLKKYAHSPVQPTVLNPAGLQVRLSLVGPWVSVSNIRALEEYIRFCLGGPGEGQRGLGSAQRWCPSSVFPDSTSQPLDVWQT